MLTILKELVGQVVSDARFQSHVAGLEIARQRRRWSSSSGLLECFPMPFLQVAPKCGQTPPAAGHFSVEQPH